MKKLAKMKLWQSIIGDRVVVYFILCYRELMKAVIMLLPLLGMTWIIGIFAVNNGTQVFAWIFAILNSLQVNYIIHNSYLWPHN